MLDATRRGFLKIGTTILGGLTVAKYTEPLIDLAPSVHDWIEDRGDFVIVRVPKFKTFANEVINKPAIFLLGQGSTVTGVDVKGFANVRLGQRSRLLDSRFDARMLTETERPVVYVAHELPNGIGDIAGLHVIGAPSPAAFGFAPGTQYEYQAPFALKGGAT